jgi:hypothetical protein
MKRMINGLAVAAMLLALAGSALAGGHRRSSHSRGSYGYGYGYGGYDYGYGGYGSNSNSVHVRGYYNSHGTYVPPHYRSAPDGNFYNNWSTWGNINPYTGHFGTHRTHR